MTPTRRDYAEQRLSRLSARKLVIEQQIRCIAYPARDGERVQLDVLMRARRSCVASIKRWRKQLAAAAVLLAVAPAARAQLSVETYEADGAFVRCLMREVAAPPHPVAAAPFGNCYPQYVAYCDAHGLSGDACVAPARAIMVDVIGVMVR